MLQRRCTSNRGKQLMQCYFIGLCTSDVISDSYLVFQFTLYKRRTQRNNSCARCVQVVPGGARNGHGATHFTKKVQSVQRKGRILYQFYRLLIFAIHLCTNKIIYLFCIQYILTYLIFFTVPYQLSSVETSLRDCTLDKKFSTVVKCSPIIRVISRLTQSVTIGRRC